MVPRTADTGDRANSTAVSGVGVQIPRRRSRAHFDPRIETRDMVGVNRLGANDLVCPENDGGHREHIFADVDGLFFLLLDMPGGAAASFRCHIGTPPVV